MGDHAGPPRTRATLKEACEITGQGYLKIRRLAVEAAEFTVSRDGPGRGFRIYLRRDEVLAYEAGGLPGLRRFRAEARGDHP